MKRSSLIAFAVTVAAVVLVMPATTLAQPAGTAVAVGYNYAGQCNVSGWTGIVQVAGGASYTVGVSAMTPTARSKQLADFIAAPTVGSVDPLLQSSLTAKVHSALAALDRGKTNDGRVAVNVLKALVGQVEAQTGKKISQEAATSIVIQADAIIAAIGR